VSPYIEEEKRKEFVEGIELIMEALRATPGRYDIHPGELNYVITRIILSCIGEDFEGGYESMNKYIGVLECVKQEFYRRYIAEYEDEKKEENGDVF